jgi:hypothetical protein
MLETPAHKEQAQKTTMNTSIIKQSSHMTSMQQRRMYQSKCGTACNNDVKE